MAEYATLLKSYRIGTVRGDRYAGEWPREQFRKRGIEYRPADKPKSDLYLDLLPTINSWGVSLLDNDRLVTQLCELERRTARSGKDSIDHHPNGHDDLANVVAGIMHLTLGRFRPAPMMIGSAPKIFRNGRELVADDGLNHIDHEFADYGRRLWEAEVIR